MKPRLTVLLFCLAVLLFCLTVPTWAFAQAPGTQTGEQEYLIGSDDILQIQVWGRQDLNGQFEVDRSGSIQVPLLGQITASGLTTRVLGRRLTDEYRVLEPAIADVIVSVVEYLSQSVNVVGEVRSPGRHGFRSIPDLWEVIHTAGGTLPQADLGDVQVVRKERQPGESYTLSLDLSGGVDETPPESLPQLRPKDTLIIPSLAGVGVSGDKFQVLGAVRTPGTYRISAAETIIEALALSGGPLQNANLKNVQLTRPTSEGAIAFQLDLEGHLASAKPLADLDVQAGDTITVPTAPGGFGGFLNGLIRLVPLAGFTLSLFVILNN